MDCRTLRRGVKGILPRNASSAEIVWPFKPPTRVCSYFDKETAEQLTTRFASDTLPQPTGLIEELTEREIEILRKLAEGLGTSKLRQA